MATMRKASDGVARPLEAAEGVGILAKISSVAGCGVSRLRLQGCWENDGVAGKGTARSKLTVVALGLILQITSERVRRG